MIVDQLFTTYTVVGKNKQFFSESRHNKMLKEDVTYRKFHNLSRMLAERKMSEKEILDLFAAIEAGANATGQNRTALGRGKDAVAGAYTSAKDAIGGVLNSIAKSTPVAGVDAAYNDATGALRNAVGNDSKVMNAIKKYRLLAKEYPKTQLFVKTALIALAGMATGGAGLPAIAGLTAAIDAAIRGEKLSSIIGKGAGAGLMGLGAQEVAAALSTPSGPQGDPDFYNDTPLPQGDPDFYNDTPLPQGDPDFYNDPSNTPPVSGAGGGTYTIVKGDQLGFIAQAQGTTPELIRAANPDIDFSKALQQGQEINLPAAGTPGQGSLWADYKGGMYGDKVPGAGGQTAGMSPAEIDQMRNQNLFRMQDQADAAYYADKPDDYGINPRNNDAVGTGMPGSAPSGPSLSFPDGGNAGTLTLPDGRQVQAYAFPQGGVQPRLGPGLEQVSVNYAGQDVTAYIKGDKAYIKNFNPAEFSNPVQESWVPAIKLRHLPADQLIDQKLTVMAWALNESTGRAPARNIHLTRKGVFTVIENVDRHRCSLLKELDAMGPNRTNIPAVPRQDMPDAPQSGAVKPGMIGKGLNWLDRTAGKVGGYLSKQAQNFTRKVTAAKLKTEWEQQGHQTDSDYIAGFLAQQGVPQGVITDVYGQMGIPYTAPATVPNGTPAPQRGAGIQTGEINAIDPDTGKPYEKEKLARMYGSGATTAQTSAAGGAQQPALTGGPTAGLPPSPYGKGDPEQTKVTVAKLSNEKLQSFISKGDPANPHVQIAKAELAKRQAGGAAGATSTPPSFNATNVMQMPGMEKYAKTTPAAPAKTANFGAGPAGYGKTTTTFKAPGAPAAPAAPKTPKVTSGGATPDEMAKYQARLAAAAKAQPVAETIKQVKKMLETVQTRDDVAFIKKYINRQFSGQLSESADAQRSHLLNEVTRIGALRRRTHSQQLAR
jgi:LysM repeat protein